ncbi:MAG: AAA family ATPase [Candidatus Micrarchaeota archaeon]
MEEDLINEIFKINEKAKNQAKKYPKKRFVYNELFEKKSRTFIGIAGLRGIGKTILLKQKLLETENAVYMSLDSLENINLYKTAETLKKNYGIKTLLLDEISYCRNWQKDIKKIYDFLDLKVWFTSSVAIDIIHSKYDLGRRVISKNVYPFSFREYLYFSRNIIEKQAEITDINKPELLQKISRHDHEFEEYINGGLIPALLEEKEFSIISNILDRIIERDLVYSLNFSGEDISNTKIMLEYIANAGIDDVSYSSTAKNIGITKYKAMQYVDALEKAFVLNAVKPTGTNVLKEPKILFVPPFRLKYLKNKDFKENIGAFREEFFVENMKRLEAEIHYIKGKKGEKKPDYLVKFDGKEFVFEIGGKRKTRTQLKNYKKEKYILAFPSNSVNPYRPLLFAGFL